LKEQVNRAGKFADGVSEEAVSITVKMGENIIKTIAQKETGTLEQTSDIAYEGETLTFYTIPALFEQILGKTDKIAVCDGYLLFNVDKFSHALQIRTGESLDDESPF